MGILDTLNPREKRTVLLSLAAVALIVGYFLVVEPAFTRASQVKSQLQMEHEKLKILLAKPGTPEALKLKSLVTAAPILEVPVSSDKQLQLLRDKLTEQLQRSGIQVKNFQFLSGTAAGPNSAGNVMLKCQGRCRFPSLLKLLEELKNNPYYVGVEELSIRADDRNRQDLEVILTVSTFSGSGR